MRITACGKCRISLVCYTGRLAAMCLCPACDLLQVDTYLDGPLYRTYNIKCPLRTLTEKAKQKWVQERNYIYSVCGVSSAINASTIIIDKGPPQRRYINLLKDKWIVPVELCRICRNKWYLSKP